MKKFLKVAAVLLAVLLLVGIGYFANIFLGNPFSLWQAHQISKAHLEKNYKNTDYEIERIGYDFKMGEYIAYIHSPTSIDVDFILRIDDGKVEFDTYETMVASFDNTKWRLTQEYTEIFKSCLGSNFYGFTPRAELLFTPLDETTLPEDALLLENLELNKLYDVKALGERQGYLDIAVKNDVVSFERAAEIVLEIKSLCDQGDAPFYAISFAMFQTDKNYSEITIRYFLYEDIYEEGLAERLEQAHEDTKAYWEKVFEEKEQREKE